MYIISQNAFYFTNNVQQKQKQQQTLLFPSLTLPPNTSTGTSTDFQVHPLISSCYHAYLWSSLPKSYLTLIYTWTMHPPKVHTQKCQIKKNTDRHLDPVGQTTFVHPTLSTVILPYLSLLMCPMLLRPSELAW